MDAYRKHPINQVEEEEIDIEHGDNEQSKYAAQRKFLIALHYHTKEYKVRFPCIVLLMDHILIVYYLQEFHIQRDKAVKRLMKSIQVYHKEKEKREALLAEKKRRDRLRMLR